MVAQCEVRSDVLIVGGGVIGLAIALELRLRGATVTLLNRNFNEAASHAAAGMLAPQAEELPPGAMLELCLRSRSLYSDWTQKLEALTGLPTGYWACGILAPMYEGEPAFNHTDSTTASLTSAYWLDRAALHQHQPGLSQEVIGGWWYPNDAQVDNRLLTKALRTAVCDAGAVWQEPITVQKILQRDDRIIGVQTADGTIQAAHYVLATGAWSQDLLPIPVQPRKGQMLSMRVPTEHNSALRSVLFGSEIYIVPRQDGRLVVGATSEAVGFTPANTPDGVQALLGRAMRLYPALRDFPLQEFWWGFRPATPDELPLLGASPYDNLTLATGHYRNGILLAPVTAQLLVDRILHQQSDPLLDAFHWSRFKVVS